MADIRVTPVLDDFNRANEDPILSPWVFSGLSGRNAVKSNEFNFATIGSSGDSYYSALGPFDGTKDIEVWAAPSGGNIPGIAWALDLYRQPGAGTLDGYRLRSQVTTGGHSLVLYRVTNGVTTQLTSVAGGGFSSGSGPTYLLFRRVAATSTLEGWFTSDSGANWTKQLSRVDSTYTSGFYLGMGLQSNSQKILAWDNFGGGEPSLAFRPQFYRRPYRTARIPA